MLGSCFSVHFTCGSADEILIGEGTVCCDSSIQGKDLVKPILVRFFQGLTKIPSGDTTPLFNTYKLTQGIGLLLPRIQALNFLCCVQLG